MCSPGGRSRKCAWVCLTAGWVWLLREKLTAFALKCFYINSQNTISLSNNLGVPSQLTPQDGSVQRGAGGLLSTRSFLLFRKRILASVALFIMEERNPVSE